MTVHSRARIFITYTSLVNSSKLYDCSIALSTVDSRQAAAVRAVWACVRIRIVRVLFVCTVGHRTSVG